MIYPTFFPHGISGLEDVKCPAVVSLKRHVKQGYGPTWTPPILDQHASSSHAETY
jgi:hypothetical protein